jgi:hypothetical protein
MQFVLLCHDCLHLAQIDLASISGDQEKLRTFGEKFRRPALIDLDMRLLVTNDAMKRLTDLSQGERVGGRPI